MPLEISDAVWDMIIDNARKSLSLETQWYSPKQKKRYQIREVNKGTISIKRLGGGKDSVFGYDVLKSQLKLINDNGGRLPRKMRSTGVANFSTIVFLHPALSWIDNFQVVVASEWSGNGSQQQVDQNYPPIPNDEGEKQKVARKIRRGQRIFRNRLLEAYNNRCCITGCDVDAVLEAAHIYDHAASGINQPENGLLLRSDIHLLFDRNLIKINPGTHTIAIDQSLENTEYAQYEGCQIADRKDGIVISDKYLALKNSKIIESGE